MQGDPKEEFDSLHESSMASNPKTFRSYILLE